ncbi:recombinase family protein [Bremerella sp. P1]|uniref:recombinase family protein n=1 Tax=Bremerella sp. P1 TaxID=3026424 RepID=UPI002367A446|nr:recombinase family protein [Bremerella sp. P1]WDI43702.1 recombinase family protein [Bremerella sp. P1]
MDSKKRYVALARVSSREQEREGFSLDVQVDALLQYADRNNGEIIRLFRIAETASKFDERTAFKELMAFAKKNAQRLDGLLFYKVDRAARNLFDYVELERLESEFGVRFISVAQPTENTPAGRMQRRMLASMASFYTEQQSLDVKEGLERRVASGLFPTRPPYGYRNVRIDGRSIVELHPENAVKIRRIFELYGYHNHTLDMLVETLRNEGIEWLPSVPRFGRSKLYTILNDRSYIGDIKFRGRWYPGTHTPIIERRLWNRVQALLGHKVYKQHQMTYASDLIKCGHCGSPITGERKTKMTKSGEREYMYYRCSQYHKGDHPRIRLTEKELDAQMLVIFDSLRVEDDDFRELIREELRQATNWDERASARKAKQLQEDLVQVRDQQNRLLNLRMLEEIDADTFASKSQELRDREEELKLEIDVADRGRHEIIDIAVKAFELSQSLREKWLTADYDAKRRLLEIICLNWTLDDVSLVPTMRKPFDLLVKGLVSKDSRGDTI